jgi:hypothetical protein
MSRGPARRSRTPDAGLPTGVWYSGNTTGVLMFSAVTIVSGVSTVITPLCAAG